MAIVPENFHDEYNIYFGFRDPRNAISASWTSGPNNGGYIVVAGERSVEFGSTLISRYDALGNLLDQDSLDFNLGRFLVATLPDGGFAICSTAGSLFVFKGSGWRGRDDRFVYTQADEHFTR